MVSSRLFNISAPQYLHYYEQQYLIILIITSLLFGDNNSSNIIEVLRAKYTNPCELPKIVSVITMKSKEVTAITIVVNYYLALGTTSGIVIKRSGKGGSEGQAIFPILSQYSHLQRDKQSLALWIWEALTFWRFLNCILEVP